MVWAWVFWLAAIILGRPFDDPVSVGLIFAGGAGVPVLAVLFAHVGRWEA